MSAQRQRILFSTFEPSGDALAADAIAVMLRRNPQLMIYALGGAKMQSAGAELIEHTTDRGSMFLETVAQVWSHRKRLQRLRAWLTRHRIDALVPLDSPAGNWSICKLVRRVQPKAKIVHLVAPQVWAWAPWRVRRLRRLTDHVLCILPFEPQWFAARGVRATFVGHPVFDPSCRRPPESSDALPPGQPRLALLPGSRRGEVTRNWPTMLKAFLRLRQAHPHLHGTVAALNDRIEQLLRQISQKECGGADWPEHLTLLTAQTDAVLDWCDLALVASGTVTLELARRAKPMVVMYNMPWLSIVAMGWMVRTRTFTLPNLVSQSAGRGRAVPELVPHFGQVQPVVRELQTLLNNEDIAQHQRIALAEVAAQFDDQRFTDAAPRQILAAIA
ncbi:MAG: hypothetical protein IH830_05330 [Planctomycetes bacterium]|nr:hypothetical protein [Planctomycetota bacterium]